MGMTNTQTDPTLADMLRGFHDRRTGTPAALAPTMRQTVTYTRDRLLMEEGDVQVWTVTASYGNGRGLLWIEEFDPDDADDQADIRSGHVVVQVINSNELRDLYPAFERRTEQAPCWPNPDPTADPYTYVNTERRA